jgi:hypothetical protein
VEEAPPEATVEPHAVFEEELQEESYTNGWYANPLPSLEDIREIRIVTVSEDPRADLRLILSTPIPKNPGVKTIYKTDS